MELNRTVVLTAWQQLNKSVREGAVRKYGLIACFVALVAWPSMTMHAFSLGIAFVVIGKRTWKERVGLFLMLVVGVIGAGVYYHLVPGIISNLSTEALVEYTTVDERVYLGGDDLRLVYGNSIFRMTSCFYTEDGLLVAGAHECNLKGVVAEPTVRAIMPSRDIYDFVPEILEDTPAGLVFGPVDHPYERLLLPIEIGRASCRERV